MQGNITLHWLCRPVCFSSPVWSLWGKKGILIWSATLCSSQLSLLNSACLYLSCSISWQYLEMQRRQMVCFLHNFKSHLTQLLKARFCYEKLNFNPIIKSKIPKVVYISEAVRWCKFIIRQKRCAQELIISIFMFQLSEPFSFLGDTPYIYC